jgi:hypothetical protein
MRLFAKAEHSPPIAPPIVKSHAVSDKNPPFGEIQKAESVF